MEEVDKLATADIWRVLKWLPSAGPSGDFPGWLAVTESPQGLRRKWAKIWPQVGRKASKPNGAYLEEDKNNDAFMEEVMRNNQRALDQMMGTPGALELEETGGF
jgi:hypothetical protein